MKLNELIENQKLIAADPNDTIASVTLAMQKHNVGSVVVVEDQRPVGIVTDRDLALAMGAQGNSPRSPIQGIMARIVRTIGADADILTAVAYLKHYEVRRLPIVDREGRLVGIVSMDDLLRLLSRELYHLGEAISREMVVK
jgi:CBS domain-containing protein